MKIFNEIDCSVNFYKLRNHSKKLHQNDCFIHSVLHNSTFMCKMVCIVLSYIILYTLGFPMMINKIKILVR